MWEVGSAKVRHLSEVEGQKPKRYTRLNCTYSPAEKIARSAFYYQENKDALGFQHFAFSYF